VLSAMAVLFLPRQFQVAVVENVNEAHLKRAAWLFPLYLLLINLFVLPIALGGLLHFAGQGVDADTFVLTLPMSQRQEGLVLLVFIGGLSAGDRHGHRRNHRPVDHGLQRPGHAAAAAPQREPRWKSRKTSRVCCSPSGVARSSSSCCSATFTSGWRARLTRWSPSA
jgi:hypothetical protein